MDTTSSSSHVFDKLLSNKHFFKLFFALLCIGLSAVFFTTYKTTLQQKLADSKGQNTITATEDLSTGNSSSQSLNNSDGQVLGSTYPQIYISGGDQGYSSGGMIALASTDEPAVVIGGYNTSGKAEIKMYKANEEALLNYLVHDKNGKQTKKIDISNFQYVTTVNESINTSSYQGSKITLPFEETGIWYVSVKLDGAHDTDAFIIRSNFGIFTKEGDNEFIFWGQDYKNKRSISDGEIKVLNVLDSIKELQTVSIGSDGIAKASLSGQADIALVHHNNNAAVVPLNLKYLNSGYSYESFSEKKHKTRYFIFTDRPLYKPGDTVNFKAILRDDDDARYTVPSGHVVVKVYNSDSGGSEKPLVEKSLTISTDGTIADSYILSSDAKTGYYTLSITNPADGKDEGGWGDYDYNASYASFNVEYFRKPEFSIDVSSFTTEAIAQDKASFTITGAYFSGQPMAGQKVKYSVDASDFYEYQYLTDLKYYSHDLSDEYRYWYSYGANKVINGVATLDKKGEAEVNLPTKMTFNKGRSQVFSIEATLEDGSQNPSFARRNMLVLAGEFGIYRKDYSYGSQINKPLSLPLILKAHRDKPNLSNIQLTAKIHRTDWIAYQDKNQKYPSYKKIEEDLPSISTKTNNEGNATLNFTPTKIGSYEITVTGEDARGNTISKVFYSYVSTNESPAYTDGGNDDLTISADKQKYEPSETAHLNIYSKIPDRDVLLTLERGRVDRYQIVRLN